ncbi:hypothetical protein [Mycolicibacter kumamotonensis]|uniref:hypothetical protein n=1 Tax=Mycolicibacter kumamotonensis TaxID=354243 RepID=UPI0010420149|nr:hypothetical protein [Mycolicibacter kumamotonensis]
MADGYNRATDLYLNHTPIRVPGGESAPGDHIDSLPGLQLNGYNATKASLIQGSAKDAIMAVKGALLEGVAWHTIEDCSYKEFGTSMRFNQRTGIYLAAILMATTD